MSKKKQKLELTWVGKNEKPQLEPRILVEDPSKSYGDPNAENMLIHGDNLLALKALEQEFSGKVKCVFIDPPYNTGSAFEQYDDGLEHSLWLSLVQERLKILKRLLSRDGSLWVTIDDNEAHYLKVICDETFGRASFVANVVWQKRYGPDARIAISDAHEHLLCYAIEPRQFKEVRNLLPLTDAQTKQFRNPDNDPRGPWKADNFTAAGFRPNQMYEITLPSGRVVTPPEGRCWRVTEEGFRRFSDDKMMYYGTGGDNLPAVKRFLKDMPGMVPWTWWAHTEVGHSQEGKKESQALFGRDQTFATPKPERLLQRIVHIASNPGDLVLDSFLGSGTTAAVAHKMGRRWIGVELGEHCETHCVPRLKQVCDGTDQGGISEAAEWKGGGGFKYYELAPSLLKADSHGNWVISDEYNADMLAAAMAKHEAFTYFPDAEIYWKQGKSSEKDFIFTTTSFVQVAFLDRLHEEMQEDEHLLICCKKYSSACAARYPNIEIRKIPKMLLGKCEFGRDDYSLNIVNIPTEEDASEFVPQGPPEPAPIKQKPKRKKGGRPGLSQPDLFTTREES